MTIRSSNETISLLLSRFPDLARTLDVGEGPYNTLGEFALLVRDRIDSKTIEHTELDQIFGFLNELGMSESDEVLNLLVVGVLEILTDSEACIGTARVKLWGNALALFERVVAGWEPDIDVPTTSSD